MPIQSPMIRSLIPLPMEANLAAALLVEIVLCSTQQRSACVQIRVMPNTPCLIGQAASAFVLGNNATGEDAEKVFALISSCGRFTHPVIFDMLCRACVLCATELMISVGITPIRGIYRCQSVMNLCHLVCQPQHFCLRLRRTTLLVQ